MLLNRSLRMAFLAVVAIAVILVVIMAVPGTQLATVKPVAAQVTGCDSCHDSWVQPPPVGQDCGVCHAAQSTARVMANAVHIQVRCFSCHEGADEHQIAADPAGTLPRMNFNLEVCEGCHLDQYNTFEVAISGKTFYGGSDGGVQPPTGWNKTVDFPYLNVLSSGHNSVLESYEERSMMWTSKDIRQSILPKAEGDLLQGGTRAAYYTGITYQDANNQVVTIPPKVGRITSDRSITTGTAVKDLISGAWNPGTITLVVPAGTTVTTSIDAVNPPRYQVKTVVTLPDGRIYTSYDDPALAETARGNDPDPTLAAEAKSWINAVLQALNLEGLDYTIPEPVANPYTGVGYHWPSVESGLQCSQCHDPHTNKLRIVNKSLIEAISKRGVNPYAATKVYDFNLATRQDQIIAVCGQCHSEQVAGYSANDRVDRSIIPWVKPNDVRDGLGNIITPGLDSLYPTLFGSLQDWTHGGPIVPWQSTDPNARGFAPYGVSYPIGAPLDKVQHTDAETFFNSPMYNVGATCTDCHSTRITRFNNTVYTTHWFASPIKLMDGFTGTTSTGQPAVFPPQNPCVKCHTTDTIAQSKQRIKGVQTTFNVNQERTQVALVNALKFISGQPAGAARDANVATYRKSAMRWEYYALADNSMGAHNDPEATTAMSNARIWVDGFIPWPLTPVTVRITSAGPDNLTLTFYDQATDETSFIIERATSLEGPYAIVINLPTPGGITMGDVSYTDSPVASGTKYFYRVAARNASGTSVFSLWAEGTTTGVLIGAPLNLTATPVSASQINLAWTDTATNETGFRIQRAKDAAFTIETATFTVGANVTSFANTALTAGTTYYYRVFATAGGGSTSSASNTASATTLTAPPNAPTNLRVTFTGTTTMNIAWTDNANNETGFYVERRLGSSAWARVATLGPDVTVFNDSGLERRKTYSYRVQAFNATGASAYSNIVSAKTR